MVAVYDITLNVKIYRDVEEGAIPPNDSEMAESLRDAICDTWTDAKTVASCDYLRSCMNVH